jgi:multiple antibiotic resistance protein
MELADLFKPILLSFIPLFIAIGALDFIPFVLSLTEGMKEKDRRKTVRDGTVAAGFILVSFLFVGKGVLLLLGVTVADFMVAGGLLLLILAIKSLIVDADDKPVLRMKESSIVPLATPLIAGPAAMTTTLILLDTYGAVVTLLSILLNCAVAWLILNQASRLRRLLGERGTQGFAKVSYILLASIAVMMIRRGILQIH